MIESHFLQGFERSFLSHGLDDFLFAEQNLEETQLGLDLLVFLIFLLHGGAIFFLTDSVGSRK